MPKTRDVFAQNLASLLADSPNVAALCRAIGINRTQFNRYLAGQAHPGPDVLDRICRHFGRDARIFLDPLAEIDRQDRSRITAHRPDIDQALRSGFFEASQIVPPDTALNGMYRLWRRSFYDPDHAYRTLARIGPREGSVCLRYFELPTPLLPMVRGATPPKERYQGTCLWHPDGISCLLTQQVHMGSRPAMLYGLIFLEHPTATLDYLLAGSFMVTRRAGYGLSRSVSILLERVSNDWRDWREVARQPPLVPLAEVPPLIRRYITAIPPSV